MTTTNYGWKPYPARYYQLGQGYGMDRILQRDGVKLRLHVQAGNHGTYAKAERWDGTGWQEVATLQKGALTAEPSYVVWGWTKQSHPGAVANHDSIVAWLDLAAEVLLDAAAEVLD